MLPLFATQENTEIPQTVVDAVKAEFKKNRASTRAEIKPTKVREYLKKLKMNKYYEHTNAICNILNGVPAPKLSAALEDRLKAMFVEIQEPFERNRPKERKNFLSYGCVQRVQRHNGDVFGSLGGGRSTVVRTETPYARDTAPSMPSMSCPLRRYTLYKFCELLGEDALLKHFTLLKSNEKLYAQDAIWKKICKDLRWEFIPSL